MKRFSLILCIIALSLTAQVRRQDEGPKLPDGRNQMDEILKAEHEKSLKDAAELIKLAEDLKIELEKNDRHVLSMSAVKKTEEIEKIAKRIRSRMKRY